MMGQELNFLKHYNFMQKNTLLLMESESSLLAAISV